MKRVVTLAVFLILTLALAMTGCTESAYIASTTNVQPQGTIITINLADDGIENPSIWEDYVAFNSKGSFESGSRNKDIYLYHIPTGEIKRITYDASSQIQPHIANNNIYWLDYRGRVSNTYYYDISAEKEFPFLKEEKIKNSIVTFAGGNYLIFSGEYIFDKRLNRTLNLTNNGFYKIYDNIAVGPEIWDSQVSYSDVFYYNIETKQKISIDKPYAQQPAIYKNLIVYADNRAGVSNFDIYLFDIETKEEIQITNSPEVSERLPAIYGNIIAYFKGHEVYYYDMLVKSETRVPNNNPMGGLGLDVYKNIIVWQQCGNQRCYEVDHVIKLYAII